MSLKRRIRRSAEKSFDRGEVVYANGYEITYARVKPRWFLRLPPDGRAALLRMQAAIEKDVIGEDTVRELERLTKTYPYAPVFYNYLAIACSRSGDRDRAEQTVATALQRFPDYLFARLNRAEQLLYEGETAAVLELLGPTLELRDLFPGKNRYHVTEFSAYYGTVGRYRLATGDRTGAERLLFLLEEVAPDEPGTRALAADLEIVQAELRLRHLGRTPAP